MTLLSAGTYGNVLWVLVPNTGEDEVLQGPAYDGSGTEGGDREVTGRLPYGS